MHDRPSLLPVAGELGWTRGVEVLQTRLVFTWFGGNQSLHVSVTQRANIGSMEPPPVDEGLATGLRARCGGACCIIT